MILQQIRSHTAGFHKDLEAKLGSKLFTPNLTPATYYDLLKAFYASYHPLESAAMRVPMLASIMRERSKLPWLEQDMGYLQRTFTWGGSNPCITGPLKTHSNATVLGMMYVMEGATLGGKHIVNYLLDFEWIDLHTCLNFFNSYGNRRGGMWKDFTALLVAYAEAHPAEAGDILAGATEAFVCIDKAVTRV